ncbi:peptidylprolyl isomerase [Rhodopirellula sp. JC639]|uniref:peptidylprolyl isomerase n=1 Tax=Stieleria mannarensis TaxID=2755585 RepID=UPI001602F852|nr:peptidylprolyl isomerase [Rhodopirellula sp. JC639]
MAFLHSQSDANRQSRYRRLHAESLEGRRLLAAQTPGESNYPSGDGAPLSRTTSEAVVEQNLVQFAKDLAAAGVVVYGAAWSPACTRQAELFEDGANELPFVEVTLPDRTISPLVIEKNITAFPTWEFPDGSRAIGIRSLDEISQRSRVPIPTHGGPVFESIGDQTVMTGSPLHLPIDAYDPHGGPLTVTVSVDNPGILEAQVISGNRSIRIDMEIYGDMVFELFEQRAPVASSRLIELARSGFYDGIDFHRVIDDFVIQGGDPTGTGWGGSTLEDFDDDYHAELQHNRPGVLSFAKAGDDTNNSQFFITEVPTRFLDFNHSVFGQLVEGESVREAISEHAVNGADRPTSDITIETIDVFWDDENSVVMLKPTRNMTGQTDVTVTVTNQAGDTFSETFAVDVQLDTHNSQPFLNAIAVSSRYPNDRTATIQVTSVDIEGDAVAYSAEVLGGIGRATATIDDEGLLLVTPNNGFVGAVDVMVTVQPGPDVSGNSFGDSDRQVITLNFEEPFEPAIPTNFIMADRIHQLHTIPASNANTAIVFRAVEDATLSIYAIGTVSLDETIHVLDGDLNSVGLHDSGVIKAELNRGELYTVILDPQPVERLFSFQSSAGPQSFSTDTLSNPFEPTDVNGDGRTTPRDVLAVVNGISLRQSSECESARPGVTFLDSNRDGRITPLDALYVLNHLARQVPTEVTDRAISAIVDDDDDDERDDFDTLLDGVIAESLLN